MWQMGAQVGLSYNFQAETTQFRHLGRDASSCVALFLV